MGAFHSQDNIKAMTSTPFPLRQINVNKAPKSPKTIAGDMQRLAADPSENRFLPILSQIPVRTPLTSRTSRIPSDSEQGGPYKQRSVNYKNKMSSPVVSSTVDISSDEGEVQSDVAESPEEQPLPVLSVQNDQTPPVTETADPATETVDQNCEPFDEGQQEQDACTKHSDEALFRRPEMVRRPTQKQNKLDNENETAADQSELSTQSTNNRKRKKSKPKVRPFEFGFFIAALKHIFCYRLTFYFKIT